MPVKTRGKLDWAKVVGWTVAALLILLCVFVGFSTMGCVSTTVPKPVEAHEASYDGNEQNSGVLSVNPNGYVVTAHFRDRYLALVATYGRDFKPPIDSTLGVMDLHDGTYHFDRQRMVYFLEMAAMNRAGLKPKNP
jgi:hypothetical protein